MELTDQEIEEIAANISSGFTCYIHKETKQIVTVNEDFIDFDGEEDEDPPELNDEEYFVIGPMSSPESYRIMEDFTESLDDPHLQKKLFNALDQRKPFQHFKYTIDDSGEENRKKWFAYKDKALSAYVLNHLNPPTWEAEE